MTSPTLAQAAESLKGALQEIDDAVFDWYGIAGNSPMRDAVQEMLPWEYQRAREAFRAAVGVEPPADIEPQLADV